MGLSAWCVYEEMQECPGDVCKKRAPRAGGGRRVWKLSPTEDRLPEGV